MALTAARIIDEVTEHMRAEQEQDIDFLSHQLDEDVAYALTTVSSPDDPSPYGGYFSGQGTYLDLWRAMYQTFESYDIEIVEILPIVEQKKAFVRVQVTVVPHQDWYGLPAGRPIRWNSAAMLEFDDEGHMLAETAYGSFPAILEGYRRTREFHGASAVRMDHTGMVVDDLQAAVDFFLELGLQRDSTGASEGAWLDSIIGLDKSNIEFEFVRTPDGTARLELCKFHSPISADGPRPAAANEFGLRHLCFKINGIDALVERLENKGFNRIGEIHLYKEVFRLCYIHGPEGIIVELAERIA